MTTTLADPRCPVCKEAPKSDGKGKLVCACGRAWLRVAGIEAPEPEATLLKAKGFSLARDIRGDTYYLGSGARTVWVYADGTFSSSPRPAKEGATLEQFLEEHLAPFF